MTLSSSDNAGPGERRPNAATIFANLEEDRAEDQAMRVRYAASHSPTWAEGRSNTNRRPWLIGILTTTPDLPNTPHPFFGPVLAGVKTRIVAGRCDLLINAHFPLSTAGPDLYAIERFKEHRVDGLIMMGISSTDADYLPAIEAGLPAVFVDFDVFGPRTGYVMSNNLEGMASMVRHLYTLGRRRIATITGLMNTRPAVDRLLGYRSEVTRLGLPQRSDYIGEGDFYHHSGLEQARRLLALDEPPDAIAAASDMMAIGAIVAIEDAGLRVPDDIAVTGFDDADFASSMRPALTTIKQNAFGLGVAAGDGILAMLDQPNAAPPTIVLPTELIIRESCGLELPRGAKGLSQ